MREIKFRAWDTDAKQMFRVWEMNLCGDIQVWDNDVAGFGHRIENYTLMQFTGLHDKNGREIYEGDMLGTKGSEGSPYPFYKTGYVIFENGAFTIQALGEDQKNERFEFSERLEVIGNIYENPELLAV